jgi:LacI family transcriptional regulator
LANPAYKDRTDGMICFVEKFTPGIYLACSGLKLSITGDVKVISFTNLPTAAIPEPPLTTATQRAIEWESGRVGVIQAVIKKQRIPGR